MKTLTNEILTIEVNSLGAELTSIKHHKSGREYLWQGEPAFWKRHSPILFPIVGGVWENRYRHKSCEYTMSQHGFARDRNFKIIIDKKDEVFYQLISDTESLQVYPFPFELQVGYRLKGNCVEVIWKVINTGTENMYFQIGAHPAFNYPHFDASTESRGYFAFDKQEGIEYILITEKGCADPSVIYPLSLDNEGLLPINQHTFDKDALIIENSQIKKVALLDMDKNRIVTLRFDAPVVGLWSPPSRNAPFVCIEPWYGRCDRVGYNAEFKDRDWMNCLEPHAEFVASYEIEIG